MRPGQSDGRPVPVGAVHYVGAQPADGGTIERSSLRLDAERPHARRTSEMAGTAPGADASRLADCAIRLAQVAPPHGGALSIFANPGLCQQRDRFRVPVSFWRAPRGGDVHPSERQWACPLLTRVKQKSTEERRTICTWPSRRYNHSQVWKSRPGRPGRPDGWLVPTTFVPSLRIVIPEEEGTGVRGSDEGEAHGQAGEEIQRRCRTHLHRQLAGTPNAPEPTPFETRRFCLQS